MESHNPKDFQVARHSSTHWVAFTGDHPHDNTAIFAKCIVSDPLPNPRWMCSLCGWKTRKNAVVAMTAGIRQWKRHLNSRHQDSIEAAVTKKAAVAKDAEQPSGQV